MIMLNKKFSLSLSLPLFIHDTVLYYTYYILPEHPIAQNHSLTYFVSGILETHSAQMLPAFLMA